MHQLITHLVATMGYPIVFVLMTLQCACIPIPSEVVMTYAGALISMKHMFNLNGLALVGTAGNVLGSILAYWVGARGGRPFIEKYGKYILLRKRDLDASDRWFAKYGEATAFFSRMLPVIRTFISLPAGIARMPFGRFVLFTTLGSAPWCYLLAYVGLKLGQRWESISHTMHNADLVIVVLVMIFFAFWLWHHLRPEQPSDATSPISTEEVS